MDEIPTEAAVKPGLGREENWNPRICFPRLEKGGVVAGATADLEHPNCSQRVSPAPRGASPAALGTHQSSVKSMSCVYESAPCSTVSKQFLQVIPNYMLLVTAHKKLMKPLPSIKCNFCMLRQKQGSHQIFLWLQLWEPALETSQNLGKTK